MSWSDMINSAQIGWLQRMHCKMQHKWQVELLTW